MKLAQTSMKKIIVAALICCAQVAAQAENLIDELEGVYIARSEDPKKSDAGNIWMRSPGKIMNCMVIKKTAKNKVELYMKHAQLMGNCYIEGAEGYLEGKHLHVHGGEVEPYFVAPKNEPDGSEPKLKPKDAVYLEASQNRLYFYLRGNPVPNLCGVRAGLEDASFPRKVKTVPWKDGKPAKAELSDYCPK
ncbi:hypothetical protein [Undibacterium sp.]|uniref:hypothetical protein n=1 Tax=Undibacterium sp. TaxID=1914977 RepID=UPI00374D9BB3